MKLFSTDTLNSSVAVTLTQITRPRVKWRSGQKAQFTCQTVLEFQSRISRNAFQIDGRYVFSVRLAKKSDASSPNLCLFLDGLITWWVTSWGKNLGLRCTPWGVRLAWRSSVAPLTSTVSVLCCASFGHNQTRRFSLGSPLSWPPSQKSTHAEMGTSLIGDSLWRFL